jgi:hypothetical protein
MLHTISSTRIYILNNNTHADAGLMNSFTCLRALLVLHYHECFLFDFDFWEYSLRLTNGRTALANILSV